MPDRQDIDALMIGALYGELDACGSRPTAASRAAATTTATE